MNSCRGFRSVRFLVFAFILLFQQPLSAANPEAETYYRQGSALADRGRFEEAVRDLSTAIDLDPEYSEAYRKRGFVYYRMKKLAEAEKDCAKALELNPQNAMAYSLRAALKRSKKDQKGAIADYEKALQLNPNYYNAMVNIAYMKIDLGDLSGAVKQCERALAKRPGDPGALLGRGQALLQLGKLNEAKQDLDQVIRKQPRNSFALTQRGICLSKLGMTEDARKDLATALKIDPSNQQAKKQLAEVKTPVIPVLPIPRIPKVVSAAKPIALPPQIDINKLSMTDYNGAISAAMEAMRLIAGPMTREQAAQFERDWSPLFEFPYPEAIAYYNKISPLLVEFLDLRAALAQVTVDFESTWKSMVLTSAWGANGQSAVDFQRLVAQSQLAGSLHARMQQIADQLKALGSPPDVKALRGKARKRHQGAVETLKVLAGKKPTDTGDDIAGVWQGAFIPTKELAKRFKAIGHPGYPWLAIIFRESAILNPKELAKWKIREDEMAQRVDSYDPKTHEVTYYIMLVVNQDTPYVLGRDGQGYYAIMRGMKTFPTLMFEKPQFRLDFGGDSAAVSWLNKMPTKYDKPFAMRRDLGFWPMDGFTEKDLKQLTGRLQVVLKNLAAEKAKIAKGIGNVQRKAELESQVNLIKGSIEKNAGFLTCLTLSHHVYTKEMAQLQKEADEPGAHGIWVASSKGGEVNSAFSQRVNELKRQAFKAEKVAAPGKTATPTKPVAKESNAELERKAKEEAIAFHKENIKIIKANMAKDAAEKAGAKDAKRREALDLRIRIAKDNIQKEKDLIASIQTGTYVHTRTEYDDYLHNQFVANIIACQQRVAESHRDAALLERLVEVLPEDEAEASREFLRKHVTAEVLAKGDVETIARARSALVKKVQGRIEQAKAQKELVKAELALTVLNGVQIVGGIAVTVASGGMGAGAAVYAGGTGYLAGETPSEIVSKAASWYSTPTFMMVEAVKGWEEGGYVSGEKGVKGAVDRLGTAFVMGKAFEYGVGKMGKAWGALMKPSAAKQYQQQLLAEYQAVRPQMERGKQIAFELEKLEGQILSARASGQLGQITQMEEQAFKLASELNANYYAKLFVKTRGGASMELAAIKHVNRVYARVDAEVCRGLAEQGYDMSKFTLEGVRNASNSMTLGMDRDWGLMNTPPDWTTVKGPDGQWKLVRNQWLTKGGKPTSIHQFQKDGHEAYVQAYEKITGQSAEQSFQTFTTKAHQESFRDLGVLANLKDPRNVQMLNKTWGSQTAGTIEFKGLDMLNRNDISTVTGYIEAGRGLSKEIDKKIIPLLKSAKPGKGLSPSKIASTQSYLKDLSKVLDDMTMNRIPPWEASNRIRTLSGGKDMPEVMMEMRELVEATFKFGGVGH